MIQINLPFNPPMPTMPNRPLRERLQHLLKGELDFHGNNHNSPIHTWHAFPAKFPPQLASTFINELTLPEDIVFDPMMGSCTTLVEAILAGRKALGTDIDPLSIRLASAKLNSADITHAYISGDEIIQKAKRHLRYKVESLKERLENRFDPKTKAFIDYWFAPDTQLELIALLNAIQSNDNKALQPFFTLVFSSIIITKSGGVSLARDLAHTRPHRVSDKKPKPAVAEFAKRLYKILKKAVCKPQTDSQIIEADSQTLPLADNCIDLIVTSPPYASNAIDYMRAHKFSLVWLGHSVTSLGKLRRKYIGGEATSGLDLPPLPQYAMLIIDKLAQKDQKKGKVLHRYYTEINRSLAEIHRVLKPDHAAVAVVGNSIIRDVDIKIQMCFQKIGEHVGLEHIHTGIRRLDRNKRMMPARWNKNSNTGIEARIHEEYVIGFLKPGLEK